MRQVSLLKGFALSLAFAAPVAAFAGVADDSKASPFGIWGVNRALTSGNR